MKITGIIAIKNEVETYKQSLKSLATVVDECIVADIGMSSEMLAHVRTFKNVKVVTQTKPVPYIELIRQSLINEAKHEWILLLDPDESIPSALMTYLRKNSDDGDYVRIPRKNVILGKWMQHSRWWPDYQIRFFKKSSAKWSTRIHSQPELTGKEQVVPAEENLAIEHHNYLTYDSYLEKSHRYARAEAEGYILRKEEFTLMHGLRKGMSEFVSRFFADDGYRDGAHGFVMAFSQFFYYFQVAVYYWEIKGYPDVSEKEISLMPSQFFSHALSEVSHWASVKKIVTDPISKIKSALLKRL